MYVCKLDEIALHEERKEQKKIVIPMDTIYLQIKKICELILEN